MLSGAGRFARDSVGYGDTGVAAGPARLRNLKFSAEMLAFASAFSGNAAMGS